MTIFDVEELPTHGGSLRIYARHADDESRPVSDRVHDLRAREEAAGYRDPTMYRQFEERVRETKRKILELLIDAKRDGKTIAGYGAPGKGNTLLNYCGIRQDFLDFTVDRNPYKHGRFTPGTHIPIHPAGEDRRGPAGLHLHPAVEPQGRDHRAARVHPRWGARFIVPIPEPTVH
jgi:hypothetical protein